LPAFTHLNLHEANVNYFGLIVRLRTRGGFCVRGNSVMRRITVLAAAGAIATTIGAISFTAGRTLAVRQPVAIAVLPKIVEPELPTGTIPSPPMPGQAPQTPLAPSAAIPSSTTTAAFPISGLANATAMPSLACDKAHALGVSRVVEIDTTGGPGFGFQHFKAYDFLQEHEVVLTFDDGPWPSNTPAVLKALADQCTKALFFPIGKHAMWHPEILKQVAAAGHTIGSHTWSHADLSKLTVDQAKEEFEKGASAVRAALGEPEAAFFRFPALRHSPEMLAYLGSRNVGVFSTDLDSFDFKIRKPEEVARSVMIELNKRGKGIVLLHDFQHSTSIALPELLAELKAGGFKIVQIKAKEPLKTLPEYDEAMMKELGGSSTSTQPTSSVVRTLE
jgi:peptidoglycan/xylan/chitin deacetylase (PgdA/CDA1 family)